MVMTVNDTERENYRSGRDWGKINELDSVIRGLFGTIEQLSVKMSILDIYKEKKKAGWTKESEKEIDVKTRLFTI